MSNLSFAPLFKPLEYTDIARNRWRMVSYGILALGLLLRLTVWWQQRSIVLDEANLIRNYVERTYGQLFQNLDYAQYAPPLFSVAVKACISLFGNNELSVRLFPLLCSMATLGLYQRLTQRWLPPLFACLALGFVAFGAIFIDYATECKQYATDGFVALGLLEVAHWATPRRLTWGLALSLALLGAVAVWLSMTAVFTLASIGLWWLVRGLQAREYGALTRLLSMGAAWAISFLVYFFLLLKANAESTYLQQFHHEYFLAFPPRSVAALQLLNSQLQSIAIRAIGKTVLAMLLAAIGLAVGTWQLVRRPKEPFWLVFMPVATCFAASALHYYSLIPRLTLFFLPLVILLVFRGLAALATRRFMYLLLVGLALVVLGNQQRLRNLVTPFYGEYGEVRAGLEHILRQQRPGEMVFMNYNVSPIAYYYLKHRNPPLPLHAVVLQLPTPNSSVDVPAAISRLHRQGAARAWLLYDRDDESFSALAAKQGRILERFNFERGYVLLVEFK